MKHKTTHVITVESIRDWLVEQFAHRLDVRPREIDVNQYFNEFGLDSTEALALAGGLESWLGIDVEAAALWYYPTIAEFSQYIAEEYASHQAAA